MEVDASPQPQAQARKSSPDLFFPVSDSEEEEEVTVKPSSSYASRTATAGPSFSGIERNGVEAAVDRRRISETTLRGASDLFFASQNSDDIIPLDSHLSTSNSTSAAGPSTRKRPQSQSPPASIPAEFSQGYLGEFVCEGWSLSKGKGYCSPGSKVVFERPKPQKAAEVDSKALARSKEKAGPAKLVNGKVVNAKAKQTTAKQVTLGAMMNKKSNAAVSRLIDAADRIRELTNHQAVRKPPAKPVVDQIIRFRNDRGFGRYHCDLA